MLEHGRKELSDLFFPHQGGLWVACQKGTAHRRLPAAESGKKGIQAAFDKLYIDKVKIGYGIRQLGIALTDLTYEPDMQLSFFDDPMDDEKEKHVEIAMVGIRNRYGKNALLKGFNLFGKATGIKRNTMVGGHNG